MGDYFLQILRNANIKGEVNIIVLRTLISCVYILLCILIALFPNAGHIINKLLYTHVLNL